MDAGLLPRLRVVREKWQLLPNWAKATGSAFVSVLAWGVDKAFGSPVWDLLVHLVTITIPAFGRQPIGSFGFVLFALLATSAAIRLLLPAIRPSWQRRFGRTASPSLLELPDPASALKAELDAARGELESLRTEKRLWTWWWNWRMDPPDLPPVPDHDRILVRLETSRFDAVLASLGEALNVVIEGLLRSLNTSPFMDFVVSVTYTELLAPTKRLLSLARNPSQEEPRTALKAFLVKYKHFCDWVGVATRHLRLDISSIDGYDAWRLAHNRMMEELNRLPNLPAFYQVRRDLKDLKQEGLPMTLSSTTEATEDTPAGLNGPSLL